jgi:hypothetical protein
MIGMCCLTISWLVSAMAPSPEAEEHDQDQHGGEHPRVLLNEVIGATSIYPQAEGELQFNLKPGYRDRRLDHLGYANLEIEYGVTDWLQFEASWDAPMGRGGAGIDTVAGFGDFELETQFTWMHMGGSLVSTAFAFETGFPTARPEDPQALRFGEGAFTYKPYVTLAVDFPDGRGQVFANLGAKLNTLEQLPLVNVGVFVVSSIVRPTLVFGWTLEEMRITPGMVFVAGKSWEFSIGVPIGLNQWTERVGVDALIIYQFNPLLMHRHRQAPAARARAAEPRAAGLHESSRRSW